MHSFRRHTEGLITSAMASFLAGDAAACAKGGQRAPQHDYSVHTMLSA